MKKLIVVLTLYVFGFVGLSAFGIAGDKPIKNEDMIILDCPLSLPSKSCLFISRFFFACPIFVTNPTYSPFIHIGFNITFHIRDFKIIF